MSEIAAKLTAVAKEIGAFAADKRNEQQRYDYISADQVLTRVGEAMAKHQLAVVPSVHEVNVNPVEYKTNGIRYDVMAVMQMDILAGDESATRPWVGMGSDYTSPDKALSKAITTGHKYFLMKLFNIGVGNPDGEHDEPPRRKKQRPAAQKTVQRQAPPPQQASNGKAERKPAAATTTNGDEPPGNLADFAKWYAALHPFYADNVSVVKTLQERVDKNIGTRFKSFKVSELITTLEIAAREMADQDSGH